MAAWTARAAASAAIPRAAAWAARAAAWTAWAAWAARAAAWTACAAWTARAAAWTAWAAWTACAAWTARAAASAAIPRAAAWAAIPLAAAVLTGCRDLSRYSTGPGEAYCGNVVERGFIRAGFPASASVRLTFDADLIEGSPGTISDSSGLLVGAPLRPIPQLAHDALSTLDFGQGRDKNLVYVVDPADPARGPAILAVLSLLQDGDAEVRLLRGAPTLDGGAAPDGDGEPLFGVFTPLRKQTGSCGF
jgi:hypothetical protein